MIPRIASGDRKFRFPLRLLLALALVLPFAGGGAQAQRTERPGPRLELVEKLIEESSAARRVEESADAQAVAQREEARSLYRQAVEAQASGDRSRVESLILQATHAMFEAVHLADRAGDGVGAKLEDDFAARLESVNALVEAHGRVSREKGVDANAGALRAAVEQKISTAESLLATGQLEDARKVLDQAYEEAKVGIEQLRGGDTLVRTLNFSSAEEEYRYELDRNDTHRMLVTVLLEEKMKQESVRRLVQPLLDKATAIRENAEQEAAQGDYASAVSTLEQSTKELVRAIRGAGVYIPG